MILTGQSLNGEPFNLVCEAKRSIVIAEMKSWTLRTSARGFKRKQYSFNKDN